MTRTSGIVLFCLAGCGGHGAEMADDAGAGKLNLALTAATSEHTYRLRAAVFDVDGPVAVTLDSEAEPDASVLNATLVEGDYSVTLRDGWILERLDPTPVELEATLISDNPALFSILPNETTTVPFRFSTDGSVVVVGAEGELMITTEVTERVLVSNGFSAATDLNGWFASGGVSFEFDAQEGEPDAGSVKLTIPAFAGLVDFGASVDFDLSGTTLRAKLKQVSNSPFVWASLAVATASGVTSGESVTVTNEWQDITLDLSEVDAAGVQAVLISTTVVDLGAAVLYVDSISYE